MARNSENMVIESAGRDGGAQGAKWQDERGEKLQCEYGDEAGGRRGTD